VSFADRLEQHALVESTMTLARERAAAGAVHGTTLVAERQSGGRGRRGRTWFSPSNAGVWLTTILRPDSALASQRGVHQLGVVAGVAVLRAVRALGAAGAMLKWPNDVLVGERKLAGVLLEGEGLGGASPFVLVGIGLNLAGAADLDIPDELATRYLGLAELVRPAPSSTTCLARLLADLEGAYDEWVAHGPAGALATFREADALHGRVIRADVHGGTIVGVAGGLSDDAALIVRTDTGVVHVTTGEVLLVRPAGGEH
jgi:BirA family transcriptional regulator, biotin operon repressor / biotin---[acetyl-CoA-carboxylase] ligase